MSQFWGLIIGVIASVIGGILLIWYKNKDTVGHIFPKIEATPAKYNLRNFAFLEDLKVGDKVIIYARTALRWIKEKEKIKKALEKDISFIFYLSSQESIKKTNDRSLIKDSKESIEVFRSEFNQKYHNFKIYIVDEIINNSVTIVQKGKKSYAIIELTQKKDVEKKIVAIVKDQKAVRILKNQYGNLKHYPLMIMDLMEDYQKVSLKHRNLSPEDELDHIINLKNKTSEIIPAIVQLSLTNRCPGECVMCSHSKIINNNELTELEAKRVISMAKELGAESLIISGGEPLMRDKREVISILTYAFESEFKIGLITSVMSRLIC